MSARPTTHDVQPRARVPRPLVAGAVRRTLAGVAGGRFEALPVTLRFWDGSLLASVRTDAPVIEVRDISAIAHLLHAPNQIGLARAWVTGALAVEDDSDLEAVLRLRGEFGALRLAPRERARLARAAIRIAGRAGPATPGRARDRGPARGPPALARARPGRDPASLRRLQPASTDWCWGRAWSTRAPTSTTRTSRSRPPRSASSS